MRTFNQRPDKFVFPVIIIHSAIKSVGRFINKKWTDGICRSRNETKWKYAWASNKYSMIGTTLANERFRWWDKQAKERNRNRLHTFLQWPILHFLYHYHSSRLLRLCQSSYEWNQIHYEPCLLNCPFHQHTTIWMLLISRNGSQRRIYADPLLPPE